MDAGENVGLLFTRLLRPLGRVVSGWSSIAASREECRIEPSKRLVFSGWRGKIQETEIYSSTVSIRFG
jgi:hypothetical protein